VLTGGAGRPRRRALGERPRAGEPAPALAAAPGARFDAGTMFLPLSKVLDVTVGPLTWSLLLLVAALAARRRPGRSSALVAAAALVLYAFSIEPVADRTMRWVEASAVTTFRPSVAYDAVIVLSGQVDASASRATGRAELTGAADRIVAGFTLLHEGHAKAVLLSGGTVFPEPGEPSEAERLAGELRAWGIAPERIVVEGASRNTRENAVESARVVAARGWKTLLLVTSAAHLSRALGCFHAVGLAPDALPVDWRSGDGRGESWLPRARALQKSTDALHELAGRVAYRIAGYE
jgi:uncharacterized SAM-binding protein YcdF (DUF218 family)